MKRQKKKSLFVRVMSTYGNFDKGFDAGPCFLFLYFPQGVKKGFFLFHQDILLGISDIHSEIFGKKKRKGGYSQ